MRIAIVDNHDKLIRVLKTFVWVRTKELGHTKRWMVLNTLLAVDHKTHEPKYWASFTMEQHKPALGATVWSFILHFRTGDLYAGITRSKPIPTMYANWLPDKEGK